MTVNKTINYNDIEQQFSRLLQNEKSKWIEMYQLLDLVEKNKLWENAGQRSFSAWVKTIAIKNKIHESVIWQRKKAGQIFTQYTARMVARGETPPDPSNVSIAAESLEIIAKIAKNDNETMDNLIDKTIQGTMGRDELRQTWRSNRDRSERIRATASDLENNISSSARVNIEDEDQIIATQIVTALIASKGDWINPVDPTTATTRKIGTLTPKYRTLTEFAVRTGSSRHARRIDALILESISTNGDAHNIRLHACEIKISESDLRNDHKITEYSDFVDYTWLIVPSTLISAAQEVKAATFGIISISNVAGEWICEVIESAEYIPGVFRANTLETALIKLI